MTLCDGTDVTFGTHVHIALMLHHVGVCNEHACVVFSTSIKTYRQIDSIIGAHNNTICCSVSLLLGCTSLKQLDDCAILFDVSGGNLPDSEVDGEQAASCSSDTSDVCCYP